MHKDNDLQWQAIWAETQKKYLEGINQLYSPHQRTSPAAFASERFFNAGPQAKPAPLPSDLFSVFNHLLNQTTSIHSLVQVFSGLLVALADLPEDNDDWVQVLHHHIDTLKATLTATHHHSPYMGVHKSLLESMQYWRGHTAAVDGRIFGMGDLPFVSALSAKMAGNRQYTEEMNVARALQGEYERAWLNYQAVLLEMALLAIDKLRDTFIHFGLSGGKITTLKQLYDLWIEAQEEAYAEIVFTDGYARKWATLVNLSLSLSKQAGRVFEVVFANADEGMREELKILFNDQKHMSEAVAQSQQALSESKIKIDALEKELIELRNMIASNSKEPQ